MTATSPVEQPWRRVLGIETSCDETAAAVVVDGRLVASSVIASQAELHGQYGGVFPEMASRQHLRDIAPVVARAVAEADGGLAGLDAVAVTRGPGLAGSLLVGVNFAKGLAIATRLPVVGVNHLEGHLYSNWLHDGGRLRTPVAPGDGSEPAFPHLTLIVSGGHTELVLVRGHGEYEVVGSTLDDAAGEAFDKVARMLGLGYPGGPAVEAAAAEGDPAAIAFPLANTRHPLDFSFSGLKTAVLRRVEAEGDAVAPARVADIAASFQQAAVAALVRGVVRALAGHPVAEVHAAGGVSANGELRRALAQAVDVPVRFPPPELCTDNAAMIAAAAWHGSVAARGGAGNLAWGLDSDVESALELGR